MEYFIKLIEEVIKRFKRACGIFILEWKDSSEIKKQIEKIIKELEYLIFLIKQGGIK